MAFIAPFRGVRFNPGKVGALEDVVTPPYDVIDSQALKVFAGKSPYSMAYLDLGKNRGPDDTDEGRYVRARDFFVRWQEEEVLVRDARSGMYLYYTDYVLPQGARLTRKGFVALVRLADFAEGIVKPHEKTFPEVTSDRLRLMETCGAQFSQIFSLFSDPEGLVVSWLEAARPSAPVLSATDGDGGRHTVWHVTDPATLARVHAFFSDKALYIADGHHRYTTALQLRERMETRLGPVHRDNPFNYTAMYLCSMEDPGLSVLPTHRLISFPAGLPVAALASMLDPYFEVTEIGGGVREVLLVEVLARMDEYAGSGTMFGVYQADDDRCFLLRLKPGAMARALGDKVPQALAELDVVVLSELVLGHILGVGEKAGAREASLRYFSDPDEALDVAVKEMSPLAPYSSLLFLMNPTPVSQVRQVADQGLIMPHKSTFFYPKILTGLVMSKMVFEEKVVLP